MKTADYYLTSAISMANSNSDSSAAEELETMRHMYLVRTYGVRYEEILPEYKKLPTEVGAEKAFICMQVESNGHRCETQCKECMKIAMQQDIKQWITIQSS